MLPAARAGFGPGVDGGNLLPTARNQIGIFLGPFNEARRRAVTREKFVNLRSARIGVTRIGIDLLNLKDALEIEQQPPTFRAGIEKEVCFRLISFSREQSVAERANAAAIRIDHAGQDSYPARRARVALCWR